MAVFLILKLYASTLITQTTFFIFNCHAYSKKSIFFSNLTLLNGPGHKKHMGPLIEKIYI